MSRLDLGLLLSPLLAALCMLAACSSSSADAPLVEYPPSGPETGSADGGDSASPAPADGGADAPESLAGTKLLGEPVFIESVTSDGHLVFTTGTDLKVWPSGAASPVTVVKDYDFDFDSFTVRGRFVVAWLGESPSPSAITSWNLASGVQTNGAVTRRFAIYPKSADDSFAYLGPAASLLSAKLWVTGPTKGAGTLVVPLIDSGLIEKACKSTIAWAGAELIVAGCTGASTTPRVAAYATDGSAATRALLEGSAPGLWLNRARSQALVQTQAASSLRAVSGVGAAIPLDTPIAQAVFSSDDSKVVYLRADGTLRRASTLAVAAPLDLGTGTSLLGISKDARFVVFATKVDGSTERTDLLVADANAPATPRTVAPEKARFHGITTDGASFVYQTTPGTTADGPLFVAPLAGGPPAKLADRAERVVFDGAVVYWQEFVKTQKSNVLKAARISNPAVVITIDQGLDPLTASAVIGGSKLFVGSKLGLWSYPVLAP